MTITITLPPPTEERLRAQATATGKDVSTLVLEAVEARLATSQETFREILAPIHEEVRRSGMTDSQIDAILADELATARVERKSRPGNGK
jgi:predicted DNA-binding protein